MFTCSECDSNVIRYGNARVNCRRYVCGANRMRGHQACDNDWRLDATWLESKLVEEITSRFTTPGRVDELIQSVSDHLSTRNRDIDTSLKLTTNQIRECDVQMKRLIDAIKSGIDAALISEEVNKLQQQTTALLTEQSRLKQSYTDQPRVDTDALRQFFNSFTDAYTSASDEERRDLLRTFVRHIELSPQTQEVRVEFYSDQTVQAIGVGEPHHK